MKILKVEPTGITAYPFRAEIRRFGRKAEAAYRSTTDVVWGPQYSTPAWYRVDGSFFPYGVCLAIERYMENNSKKTLKASRKRVLSTHESRRGE